MKERSKNFIDYAFSYLVILPVFWLVIKCGNSATKIKEFYYIVLRIPYYKAPDKFGYYVVRTDR